jgi:hypothetical protein
MGLFSGKKVSVSTATMHLSDASDDPIMTALLTAIIGNKNIPDELLATMLSGLGVKMRPAFNYARDHYTLGLPSGKTSSLLNVDNITLAGIIANEQGYTNGVVVNLNVPTTITAALLILPELTDVRGYNLENNSISNYPPTMVWPPYCKESDNYGNCLEWEDPATVRHKVKVKSIVLMEDNLQAEVVYEMWTERIKLVPYEEEVGDGHWKTVYQPELGWSIVDYFTEYFDIPDPDNVVYDEPCIYAQYQVLDATGEVIPQLHSWIYVQSDGTYPELNPPETPYAADSYLPVIPIRYENVDYTDAAHENTDLYKTSKRLLRKLGFDIKKLGEQINNNPDIAEIDHAYVMFGVDLQTEVSQSLWYVGLYFDHLHSLQEKSKFDFLNSLNNPLTQGQPFNSYHTNTGSTESNFTEHGLDLTINYDFIETSLHVGRIHEGRAGRVGRAKKSFSTYTVLKPDQSPYSCHGHGDVTSNEDFDAPCMKAVAKGRLIIDMQISKRMFKRVIISGLEIFNRIYRRHGVRTTIIDVAQDSEEHNFILPVQYNIAQAMRLWTSNMLYVDSTLMVINTYVVTKLKWYQTAFFKFLLMIVAVIITIYTGQAWLVMLVEAMTAGALAVLMFIVLTVVVSYVINLAMDWLVRVAGAKWGIIGAIVMAIVATIVSRNPNAMISVMSYTLSTAQLLMQAAMALISSVNSFLVNEGRKIVDQYMDFREKMEDRWEELRTAQDLLEHKSDLDPLTYVETSRYTMFPSESPTGFIQRCLGLAENSKYVIHDDVPNYVSMNLNVPRTVQANLYNQNINI